MKPIPVLPMGYKNPIQLLKRLTHEPEVLWLKRGEKRALTLFKLMARRVPAYKDFLKRNKIDPEKIKTIQDFKLVPTIDKNNYLRAYPREKLCWDGKFAEKSWVISATSGSTGESYYFPRQPEQDWHYAITAELYLRTNFEIHKKNTLYIIGFPMGIWIGGLFTYQALELIAKRGIYNLSVITPGINKIEIIKAVKHLGAHFDQIIIGGYAPFLKDTLDDGIHYGVNWEDYNLGFIFSAEAFSETFRDYVIRKTGLKNPYTSTLNHYGTVDLGTMSHETPLAIMLRRMAVNDKQIYAAFFGQITKLPTLTQYNPEQFFFEADKGNLICSSFSGLPLVRYDLKDHGGIFTLTEIDKKFRDLGLNVYKKANSIDIENTIWNLPFVYVYERSDFSVSFYAFQIYPETVRKALQEQMAENELTGKFTMMVIYDKAGNQQFHIHIEMKRGVNKTKNLSKKTQKLIVKQLLEESSEYRKTHEEYGERVYPILTFWPYEHPTYFRPGVKQKWVQK